MSACPFSMGYSGPHTDVPPEVPCPICGDLGTFDASQSGPSKCVDRTVTAVEEIVRLRAENERLRGLLREVWKWGINGRLRGDLVIRIERNLAPVAAGSEGTASVVED